MDKQIGVGLLGMGVVGGAVARVISEKSEHITNLTDASVEILGVLVRDRKKKRSFDMPCNKYVSSVDDILDNDDIDIVVELMGGEHPALECILGALNRGKHVVTANKEVISKHGPRIFDVAREKNVRVLFEASVAGGTPIISPLMRDLTANDVVSIKAIINGTTNYILSNMATHKREFSDVLEEAQVLGYAESDPYNDIEGLDAAYKLSILSTLAFRTPVIDSDVYREGISRLVPEDFQYADELGYSIKLLGIATREEGKVQARVHPVLVPADDSLAKVSGVLNAIEVETDLCEKVVFQGPGAGPMPTSSAVIADIVNISRSVKEESSFPDPVRLEDEVIIQPISDLVSRYYIRLEVGDLPGVLAQIASILGEKAISISTVVQKRADGRNGTAELVIMTHLSKEQDVQLAIKEIECLESLASIGNVIRVSN